MVKKNENTGFISRRQFLRKVGAGAVAFSGIYIIPRGLLADKKLEPVTSATPKAQWNVIGIKEIDHNILKGRFDAPVAVYRSDRPAEAAYNVLKILKPALKADRALIKPNLASMIYKLQTDLKQEDYWSLVTHPGFVEGIVAFLKEQGIKPQRITVAEGTGSYRSKMQNFFDFLGYTPLSSRMGFKLVSLNESDVYEVRVGDALRLKKVLIAKPLIDYITDEEGVLINVPKLKMHNYAVTTLAMKNLIGTIYVRRRGSMHTELHTREFKFGDMPRENYIDSFNKFSERLCDLSALAPDINVIDGVTGGEGCGIMHYDDRHPERGRFQWSVPSHIAFAGTNAINVDAVATNFMGYSGLNPDIDDLPELKTLPWLEYAGKNKYGKVNPADVKLVGAEELPKYEKKFRFFRLTPLRGDPRRES